MLAELILIGFVVEIGARFFPGRFAAIFRFFAVLGVGYRFLQTVIRRFYDLNMSGWHVLTTAIPLYSLYVIVSLCFKEGDIGINEYDEPIKYKKLLKNNEFIDIFKDRMFVDNEEFIYELYLDGMTIYLSDYSDKRNILVKYLLEHCGYRQEAHRKIFEMKSDKFAEIVKELNLITLRESFYIVLKNIEIFIRKEDYKYTVIMISDDTKKIPNDIKALEAGSEKTRNETYLCYKKIEKDALLRWLKNMDGGHYAPCGG
jgi:hypothetical protein